MAALIADRVRETTTTTGTGSVTLAGAVTGCRTFNSAFASGVQVAYCIDVEGGADWEVGLGTFTSPSTLSRDTILASSTGSAVSFAAGTKRVFNTLAAAQVPTLTLGAALDMFNLPTFL